MNSRDDLVALVGAEQERILEGFVGLAVHVGSPDRLQFWEVADRVVRHEVAAEIVLCPALRDLPGGELLAQGMVRSQNLIQRQIFSMERGGIGPSSFERGLCDLWSMVHDQAERQTAYVLPPAGRGAFPGDQEGPRTEIRADTRYPSPPSGRNHGSRAPGEHHRRPDGGSRRVDPRLSWAHAPPGQLTGPAGRSPLWCSRTACGVPRRRSPPHNDSDPQPWTGRGSDSQL